MRVTEPAQHAVTHAKQEAGRLGHDHVGTEHLLLGLLHDVQCRAVATLGEPGIAPELARRRVQEIVGQGPGEPGLGFGLPTTKAFTLVLALAGTRGDAAGPRPPRHRAAAAGLGARGGRRRRPRPPGPRRRPAGAPGCGRSPGRGWRRPRAVPTRPGTAALGAAAVGRAASGDPAGPPASAAIGRPAGADLPGGLVGLAGPALCGPLRHPRTRGGAATTRGPRLLRGGRPGRHHLRHRTSSHPNFGMVRIHQRTFVPSPPAGTELLELRFTQPDTMPGQAPPLLVSTVDLP